MSSGSFFDSTTSRSVGDLVASWAESESDPLLSEHTLLSLASGDGWFGTGASPISALLTLAPTSAGGVGLVEVAGTDDGVRLEVWRQRLSDLLEEARRRRYRTLEVIDRGGVLAGPDTPTIRSVVRMRLAGVRSTQPQPGISAAETEEVDAVLGLIREAFAGHPENGDWTHADLEKRMAQAWFDPSGMFVGRDDGRIVGLCWTKVHPDGVGEIYLLAVSPRVTGRGWGKALVDHGVSYMRDTRNCIQIIVYAEESNKSALNLYEGAGFVLDRVDKRIRLDL